MLKHGLTLIKYPWLEGPGKRVAESSCQVPKTAAFFFPLESIEIGSSRPCDWLLLL